MEQTDEIKSKIDIVEYIGETVQLKKAGRNFKGLCPFHNEKSPSFVVSPERQIWHCFGCSKGGDVFSFLTEIERIEFPEALSILAEKAGVTLRTKPFENKESQTKKRLLSLNHLTSEYYHYLLTKHAIGKRARKYLKERGVTDNSIKTFKLGFAPEAWDNVYTFLTKKKYHRADIEKAGLILRGKRGHYDRFRNRIMFPLFDHRGNVLGFSGRILEANAREGLPAGRQAKYINSPETPLYTKGHTVYGLHATKDAIRRSKRAIVVEGEFDVISSFQVGVSNIVAIKGSALTEQQVLLLKRFAENLHLALDQDSAGDAATRRGIEIAGNAGLSVYVITVPAGKDPDDAARTNVASWKKAVKKAVPFYDFLLASAFSRHDESSAYGKRKITDELLPIFSRITNSIVQAHYTKALAERLGVREETIIRSLKKKAPSDAKKKKTDTRKRKSTCMLLEEYILALLVQADQAPLYLARVLEYIAINQFSHPPVKKIIELLSAYLAGHSVFRAESFAKELPKEVVVTFDVAYMSDIGTLRNDDTAYERELMRAVLQLKKAVLRRELTILSTKLKQEKEESAALHVLNQELGQIAIQLKKLSSP